jgi:hypothetical protein
VDGVLNALSLTRGRDDPGDWECFFQVRTKDGRGPFTIRVPKGTRGRLSLIAGGFDIVWATTWMEEAAALLSPVLGLGEDWPYVEMVGEISLARQGIAATDPWKLPAIERWAASTDRSVAWVDDDFGPDAVRWAERRAQAGSPTILVPTDPLVGLTDQHVAVLLAWRAALEAPSLS